MKNLIAATCVIAPCLAGSILPAWAVYTDPISPTQALSNIGLCMTVEGHATLSPAAGRLGVQLTLDDGNTRLIGYIATPASFPDLNSLDGQTVDLTGVVQVDYGKPEIEMNSADYVWAAGGKPDTLVTCENSG
jgi:hypothetical protein